VKISRGWFAALLLCLIVPPVFGETEKITLYADAAGTDCSITDAAPGLVEVHIFHVGSTIRVGSQFSAPKPACWTQAIYLGEVLTPLSAYFGSTQTGLTVAHYNAGGPCLEPPIYIGTMTFWGMGAGQSCCEYPVLPAPSSVIPGSIVAFGCPAFSSTVIDGGKAIINETEDCLCNPPLAVEETTWGRVKALYR